MVRDCALTKVEIEGQTTQSFTLGCTLFTGTGARITDGPIPTHPSRYLVAARGLGEGRSSRAVAARYDRMGRQGHVSRSQAGLVHNADGRCLLHCDNAQDKRPGT